MADEGNTVERILASADASVQEANPSATGNWGNTEVYAKPNEAIVANGLIANEFHQSLIVLSSFLYHVLEVQGNERRPTVGRTQEDNQSQDPARVVRAKKRIVFL